MALRVSLAAVAIAVGLAGCGSSGSTTTIPGVVSPVPGGADPAAVKVIDGWVTTLRQGDIQAAAHFFAIPSVASNPPTVVRITDMHAAVLFNKSLPCGARLVR